MKSMLGLFLAVVCCLALTPQLIAQAPAQAVPRMVRFQGALKDAQGQARTGTVGVTFAIYAGQEGGPPLWLETQNVTLDEQGHYTALLGSTKNEGLPLDLFSAGESRWLGVHVNLPDEVEQPRVLLVSVPYALRAADAETLGGLPASAFVQLQGGTPSPSAGTNVLDSATVLSQFQVNGTGTPGRLAKFTTTTDIGDALLSESGGRINVGGGVDFSSDFSFVGNAEPAASGRVQMFDRAFQGFVIRGLNIIFETLQGSPAVPTEALRITQTGNIGIGTNSPSARLDVVGDLRASGQVNANEGNFASVTAMTGIATSSISQIGGTPITITTGNLQLGGGLTMSSGVLTVGGNIQAGSNVNVTGGLTTNGGGGLTINNGALVVSSPSTNSTIAGNLNVNGTLSKGGGSFKIDHPLEPTRKYLYHSFVESPDMMNIYNGVVKLDARGEAWVDLPDWFEALNRDFRYQLTAMGGPAPNLHIAREIAGNRFKIAGGRPHGKVSWQVTGIRHDAYATAHRIPVEEEKPLGEQGTYLHPELFGQPQSMSVEARREKSRTGALAASKGRE